MSEITFIRQDGSKTVVDAPENWSLMQIAVDNGIEEIEGACGGSMACATCHCYIDPAWKTRVEAQDNEMSDEEEDMLDVAFHVRDSSRLGCQVKVTKELDGLIVAMPSKDDPWA